MSFYSPTLLISLDFELHWGRFDKYDLENYQVYYENTLQVIPRILDLFEEYGIHATWATVGSLLAESWEEWDAYKPKLQPQFEDKKFSAYEWAKSKKHSSGLFALELAKRISLTPGQEIGSHTFSHFYTGVKGSDSLSFKEDLISSIRISEDKLGIRPASLVFPRNQYNRTFIQVASDVGFRNFRTNPASWFWENTADETLIKKVFRTGDTLYPLGRRTSFQPDSCSKGEIPASRLLRPFRKGSIFNQIRVKRIKSELVKACEKGEVYHLWWHPHNFGHFPEQNLAILKDLLKFIQELKMEKGLVSLSMDEFGSKISENHFSTAAKQVG